MTTIDQDKMPGFFRPGYAANLITSWIPALDGVRDRLDAGTRVADVGCGHGASTVLMALAYSASTFVGYDHHAGSVEQARKRAAGAGVADRCRFEVASATDFPGAGYELVTSFDCLHDGGDPVGAATHVRESLAPDGTWLLVEPAAGDLVTIREVAAAAGFTRFQVADDTRFHLVFDVRP